MKNISKFIFFTLSFLSVTASAEGKYFVGVIGSRLDLDFKNASVNGSRTDINGDIEMLGASGGILELEQSKWGHEISLSVLKTNRQDLTPDPAWSSLIYYRIITKFNYTFGIGLFLQGGIDLLGTFDSESNSEYSGIGVDFGFGYLIDSNWSIGLSTTNNNRLLPNGKDKSLKGGFLDLSYRF